MTNLNLDYFYGNSAEQYSFFSIPKVLFTNPAYRSVSDTAKILYSILLSRNALSQKNNWIDKQNRSYIIFTIEEIKETLCCGNSKAVKALDELVSVGLIEKCRRGQGLPTIIYVKNFATAAAQDSSSPDQEECNLTPDTLSNKPMKKPRLFASNSEFRKSELKNSEKQKSRLPKMGILDFSKAECIYKDFKYTYRDTHTSSDKTEIDKAFKEFWKATPKKRNKTECREWWTLNVANCKFADEIIEGMKKHSKCDEWQKERGRYRANPLKWLQDERWTEEVTITERSYNLEELERSSFFDPVDDNYDINRPVNMFAPVLA
ncbi:replication initiator protein A [Scatolibacter rhodanostii]|uniref:replication initiator protein A n=1 Tax=Scatolibacter rhodanostii TaxID=2014781 RepID=UPI000C08ABDF|nr:replication initiator protein A [Scatolibacter rhodanostii]